MRIVAALGGNTLPERGESPDAEIQESHVTGAVKALAPLLRDKAGHAQVVRPYQDARVAGDTGGVPAGNEGSFIMTPFAEPRMFSYPGKALNAEIGDTVIIESDGISGIPRIGQVVGLKNPDGSPPYVVRWLAGEYESLFFPARGVRIEKGH